MKPVNNLVWMNLPQEYKTPSSKFVILPISYEKDLTYGQGASKGPTEIIKASQHLEYYDDQFDCEPFEQGIITLPQLNLNENTPEEMVNTIKNTITNLKDKFIISLGGDHSVTIGIIKGLQGDFSIIQFDAHADLFHSWNGSQYNHRTVAQRISLNHELLQIGIRSMDIDEKKIINNDPNIHLISAYDFNPNKILEILPKLKDKVYITIDVDVFNPSILKNTGTPEPGGLTWENIIDSLKIIFQNKQVIGADITEFAPNNNFESEAYMLAKLAYKIMALQHTLQ